MSNLFQRLVSTIRLQSEQQRTSDRPRPTAKPTTLKLAPILDEPILAFEDEFELREFLRRANLPYAVEAYALAQLAKSGVDLN